MPDQATELRQRVLQTMRDRSTEQGPAPRLIVMAGGKSGVGVSTLAVNLAVAMAGLGSRVVLVDADRHSSTVAALCGLPEKLSPADILASRRNIHEAVQRGPGNIGVVSGVWAAGKPNDGNELNQMRLLNQFRTLGPQADVVLVDAGNGPSDMQRRFWRAADDVLLVTTPDAVSVMETYAMLKRFGDETGGPVRIVVNRAESEEQAIDVQRRIDQSCRRFLGRPVGWLGFVSPDPAVIAGASAAVPFVLAETASRAAREIRELAAKVGLRLHSARLDGEADGELGRPSAPNHLLHHPHEADGVEETQGRAA